LDRLSTWAAEIPDRRTIAPAPPGAEHSPRDPTQEVVMRPDQDTTIRSSPLEDHLGGGGRKGVPRGLRENGVMDPVAVELSIAQLERVLGH
jgi:hypothetical protein